MQDLDGLPEVNGFQLGGLKFHKNLCHIINVNQEELRMRPKTVMADCLHELSRQQSFAVENDNNLQNRNLKRVRSASGTSFPKIRNSKSNENYSDKMDFEVDVEVYLKRSNSRKSKNSASGKRLSRVLSGNRRSKQKKSENKQPHKSPTQQNKSRCTEKSEDKIAIKSKPPPQLRISDKNNQCENKSLITKRPIWNSPQKTPQFGNNTLEINTNDITKSSKQDTVKFVKKLDNSNEDKNKSNNLKWGQRGGIGEVRRCHSYTGVSNKPQQNNTVEAKQLWRNISMHLRGGKHDEQQIVGRRFSQVDIEEQVKKAQERVLMRKRLDAQQHKKELSQCFQQKQAEKQYSQVLSDRERRRINIYALNNILKMCEEARAKQWLLEHNLGQPSTVNSCLAA